MDRAQLPIELALDALDGADADMMLGGELADAGAALLQGVPDFALDGDRDRWPAETLALGAQDQPADKRSEDSSAVCRKRAGISAARPSAAVLRSGERYTVAWNT